MIDEFSLRDIIKGCIDSQKFNSPECKLLKRIGAGEDLPEYPEYDPEKRYFCQAPGKPLYGPTGYFDFSTIEELIEVCVTELGEYPSDIWEE